MKLFEIRSLVRTAALAVLVLACAGLAAGEEFVGWLADEKCAQEKKASSGSHGACAKQCYEKGEPIVLVTEKDGKVYRLDEDDKTLPHLGKKVKIQGTADDNFIEVDSVTPVK
jgi:hypothetical protein